MRSSGQNKFDSEFPLYIFGFPLYLQKVMATKIKGLKILFDSAFICIYTATHKLANRFEQFLVFCETLLFTAVNGLTAVNRCLTLESAMRC